VSLGTRFRLSATGRGSRLTLHPARGDVPTRNGSGARLLHDMRQLVGNQPPALVAVRRERPCVKDDLLSNRVGAGRQVLCGPLCGRTGVNRTSEKS
jgi:hypothetical protein